MPPDPDASVPALSGYQPSAATRADGDAFATAEPERYQKKNELGRGGMGRVVVAYDRRLARDVALKEVGANDPATRDLLEARLAREATVTARLEHPGIVAVYDAGRGPDGTPFYTMRVVRGRSLHDELRKHPDAQRTRFVRHVLDAANAVAWAHKHGVVHRDLKPANIMVGEFGETQVVDWGLAHVIGEDDVAGAGTPDFMSPEQVAGRAADQRSDVWSLGAVLRAVVGEAAGPELEAIIARAQADDPGHRYPDAKAFADDLAAWLDGRRVGAYAYSPWELVRRLVVAWRVPLAIAAAALVAIAIAVAISYAETAAERDRAAAAEVETRRALVRADADLARALLAAARERLAAGARPEAEVLAAASLAKRESPEARGLLALTAGDPAPTRVATDDWPVCQRHRLSSDGVRLLCLEARALSLFVDRALVWRHPVEAHEAALLEDENVVVAVLAGLAPGVALVMSADDGSVLHEMIMPGTGLQTTPGGNGMFVSGSWQWLAWSASDAASESGAASCDELVATADDDGRRAWLCADGRWGLRDHETLREGALPAPFPPASLALVPGTDLLVVGSTDGELLVHDLADNRERARASGCVGLVDGLSLSDDRALVAVRDEAPGVRLFDLVTGTWRGRLPGTENRGARFVSTGPRRLVTWGADHAVTWDIPRALPGELALPDGVTALDLDRTHLVAATAVASLVIDLGNGRPLVRTPSASVVKSVALSRDGRRYARTIAGATTPFDVFTVPTGERVAGTSHEENFARRVVALDDGRWLTGPGYGRLALRAADGTIVAQTGADVETIDLVGGGRSALALLDGERRLVRLTLGATSIDLEPLGADRRWDAIAMHGPRWAAGGDRLLAVDGVARRALATDLRIVDLAWSRDGRWLAAGGLDGAVAIWDLERPGTTPVARVDVHRERVGALAFGAGFLLSGGWDDRVRRLDLAPLTATADALLAASAGRWRLSWQAIIGGADAGDGRARGPNE